MIGREQESAAGTKEARHHIQSRARNETPVCMPQLRPRVGKQEKDPVQAGIGEMRQQQPGIVGKDADVAEIKALDTGEQPGNAVDVGFAADEADIAVLKRLAGQMFAGAEADLEPDGADGAVEQSAGFDNEAARR
jgi:hypothetical protein